MESKGDYTGGEGIQSRFTERWRLKGVLSHRVACMQVIARSSVLHLDTLSLELPSCLRHGCWLVQNTLYASCLHRKQAPSSVSHLLLYTSGDLMAVRWNCSCFNSSQYRTDRKVVVRNNHSHAQAV